MKIIYFFTELGLTGGPIVHYNMMNGLLALGHEVYVVTKYVGFKWHTDAHKEYLPKQLEAQQQKPDNSPLPVKLIKKIYRKSIRLCEKIMGLINTNNKTGISRHCSVKYIVSELTEALIEHFTELGIEPDIFVATYPFTADAVYKLQNKSKIVIHNLHFEELMFDNPYDRAEIRQLTLLPFNHVVNSLWLKNMFKYFYNIDAELITPALDKSIFQESVTCEKFNSPETITLITYCDPDRPFKGYAQQMTILTEVYKTNQDIRIQIYGKRPLEKDVHFKYEYLGWVSQETLSEHYRKAHILFSSSWYESFPFPPIEAMMSHCAVVSGKYGTEDYLIDNETGLVVDPFNIKETVKKLTSLILDHEKMSRLATQGHSIALQYEWKDKVLAFDTYLKKISNTSPNIFLDNRLLQAHDFSQIENIS